MWIDTHCHLDAPEFDADRAAAVARARAQQVTTMVLPAVAASNFDTVRGLAREFGLAYALGIHPLCAAQAAPDDLDLLREALRAHRDDPRLVAVGEIGIDRFVPPGATPDRAAQARDLAAQQRIYQAQLVLARDAGLPVILHVRRSADDVLKGLRRVDVPGGIAHAFNGSDVQAAQFVARGFKLGFGGAMTFERALRIRALARSVPDGALVLETDSPDIPPQWLYRSAQDRRENVLAGPAQARNEPAELPRIAATLAALRGWTLRATAEAARANSCAALPRLAALLA